MRDSSADDARTCAGAELFEQGHALAGPAEPVGGGAAHDARADDYYVIHACNPIPEIPRVPMLSGFYFGKPPRQGSFSNSAKRSGS